jgi:NAD(P)-dependent dehydrogenase (short-subunit alcohol dehydrogenase family)
MKARFDYSGCNVFVMGGTSGINLGIAEAFAAAGARVGVASRKADKVDAARTRLAALGAEALGYAVDVRDADGVAAVFDRFAAEAGPIDVLVSGAAGNFPVAADRLTPNGFKTVVDIDLVGTFHVMRGAHPHLRKPGASIINISAPQSMIPMAMQLHVCAAKAGVDMVTRTLALEWGPQGIRVNSVVPGPIEGTEGMARLAPSEEARRRAAEGVPLRRLGTVADVAGACLFLGSEAAAYVSGSIVMADGGWSQAGTSLGL